MFLGMLVEEKVVVRFLREVFSVKAEVQREHVLVHLFAITEPVSSIVHRSVTQQFYVHPQNSV